MLTTAGSTCLAMPAKDDCSWTGLGMVSGVAPGATVLSLAALTPVLTKVPITTPKASVNRIRVKDSSFCVRNLSRKLMDVNSLLRGIAVRSEEHTSELQ